MGSVWPIHMHMCVWVLVEQNSMRCDWHTHTQMPRELAHISFCSFCFFFVIINEAISLLLACAAICTEWSFLLISDRFCGFCFAAIHSERWNRIRPSCAEHFKHNIFDFSCCCWNTPSAASPWNSLILGFFVRFFFCSCYSVGICTFVHFFLQFYVVLYVVSLHTHSFGHWHIALDQFTKCSRLGVCNVCWPVRADGHSHFFFAF